MANLSLPIFWQSATRLNQQWQKVHAIELQDWPTKAVLAFQWGTETKGSFSGLLPKPRETWPSLLWLTNILSSCTLCLVCPWNPPNPIGFWNPTQQPPCWKPGAPGTFVDQAFFEDEILKHVQGEIFLKVLIWKFIIIQISLEPHPTTHWKLDAPAGRKSLKETAFTGRLPRWKGEKGRPQRQNSFRIWCPFEPLLGHNAH